MTEYTICAVKWASTISMRLIWPRCVCVCPSHHGWERKRKTGGQCDWNCMQSNAAGTWAQQPPIVCAQWTCSRYMLLVVFAGVFLVLLVKLASMGKCFFSGQFHADEHAPFALIHTLTGQIKNVFWHFRSNRTIVRITKIVSISKNTC